MSVFEEKRRLRAELRERQNALDAGYMAMSNGGILKNVLSLPCLAEAETIFAYHSVGREADTRALTAELERLGKRVALPVTDAEGELDFALFSPSDRLLPDSFGIPAPGPDAERLTPRKTELLLVPALAFDAEGFRLGRGAGCYDRYIARVRCATAGLCRERLLFDKLPREEHDRRVDIIVTESRIIKIRG